MTLKTLAESAFAAIKVAVPDAVSTVIYNGQTAYGVSDTSTGSQQMDGRGELGADSGIVRVKASDLTTPGRGDTILIGGSKATVTATRTDSNNVLLTIEYTFQRPIEGV